MPAVMSKTDLLIVGAGPAGMMAAITARRYGIGVLVVDDQAAPGGQIWRSVETQAASERGAILGRTYQDGKATTDAFRASGAHYEPRTQLWQVEPGFRAFVTHDGKARTIEARAIILATGAQERPAPFPGWTVPGVLTVGAAQVLLKTAGQIPAKPVWVAGCGPVPLLYIVQLLNAGGQIAGYLDTTPAGSHWTALRYLPRALRAAGALLKGLAWKAILRHRRVPVIRHVVELEAHGSDRIESLSYRTADGREETVSADHLLVHEGVVPNVHVPLGLGCAVEWRDQQDCYVPVLDPWGETSKAGIFVAGDGAGIAGAKAAQCRGALAAHRLAVQLGYADEQNMLKDASCVQKSLARELALRPFLDTLFRPRSRIFSPTDDTVICRCEEVTAGEIRAMAQIGGCGPNQIKAFTRAGMGPCQGRQCGYTVTRILAEMQNCPASEIGFYRVRPPLKPVTLGELATLDQEGEVV
ncbi:FAD-dependent oxidoreductase [Bradyrhizobium sp. 83012]|uniref:FAD-dependent oxidoreductase n=2 Tax=Bradyrhizobium aeschynomenes TaxID=2734909 RepID=A0ABX2CDN8_9BRAD|nr:FAD-dependent oxidoreductase [Bradyrhizobium aeschynomenes]NPV20043.1 FAD-dependent oxidoreductase [Bradyrhizobium aeschynomenes]